jgi:hypothetical protein
MHGTTQLKAAVQFGVEALDDGGQVGGTRLRKSEHVRIEDQQAAGWAIVAVELADGATRLPRLERARQRTVLLLSHWQGGVPRSSPPTSASLAIETSSRRRARQPTTNRGLAVFEAVQRVRSAAYL